MKILIINNGTKHLNKLKTLLENHEVNVIDNLSNLSNLTSYDCLILSGSSQLSLQSAPEIYRDQIAIAKNIKKLIIGICLGAEIIARAYDSKIEYSKRKIKGVKSITIYDNTSNESKEIKVYEAHHYSITDLGRDLIPLAESKYGIEIFKHRSKPIYGMQFHPEAETAKTFGDEIFRLLLSKQL